MCLGGTFPCLSFSVVWCTICREVNFTYRSSTLAAAAVLPSKTSGKAFANYLYSSRVIPVFQSVITAALARKIMFTPPHVSKLFHKQKPGECPLLPPPYIVSCNLANQQCSAFRPSHIFALSVFDDRSEGNAEDRTDELEDWDEGGVRYAGYAARAARVLAVVGRSVKAGSRYLAYSSDVGEAARPLVSPMFVRSMYGVAFGYVFTDIYMQSYATWRDSKGDKNLTCRVGLETATFQILGSLIMPTIIIHTAVHQAQKAVAKSTNVALKRYGPTALGLVIIPFLPFTIDEPIEHGVEKMFHKFWPLDDEGSCAPWPDFFSGVSSMKKSS